MHAYFSWEEAELSPFRRRAERQLKVHLSSVPQGDFPNASEGSRML